ncbi:hypothetical protein C1646_695669, partial [Rhizophagus diaphanus]
MSLSITNHQQQYDANYADYQQYNNQQSTPDQQTNVASPNHNQQYQQHDIASPNSQQHANYQQSPGRQPMSKNNVTTFSDQQSNVSSANSPNHNQQHNIASPNHQQQYDANYQYIHQPDSHNHHHNYQQSSDNNNHDPNNTNHNNNQPPLSNNDSSPQFSLPQSGISLNITINSPQSNFIIIPNMDIQQVLAFL